MVLVILSLVCFELYLKLELSAASGFDVAVCLGVSVFLSNRAKAFPK